MLLERVSQNCEWTSTGSASAFVASVTVAPGNQHGPPYCSTPVFRTLCNLPNVLRACPSCVKRGQERPGLMNGATCHRHAEALAPALPQRCGPVGATVLCSPGCPSGTPLPWAAPTPGTDQHHPPQGLCVGWPGVPAATTWLPGHLQGLPPTTLSLCSAQSPLSLLSHSPLRNLCACCRVLTPTLCATWALGCTRGRWAEGVKRPALAPPVSLDKPALTRAAGVCPRVPKEGVLCPGTGGVLRKCLTHSPCPCAHPSSQV